MNKILVIGAGIFGLDLAVELSKRGYEVTIFEKMTQF
jgi:protoporphyrinogen oxidase